MKKFLLGSIAIAAIAVMAVTLSWDVILQQVIKSSLLTITTRFQTNLLGDGALHVWFCGTGSPQVERDRAQSCTAILAGGSFLVFDTGAGSGLKADLGNLPLANLEAVFFTHLHSDHITDLPVFMNNSWRYGRQRPLNVFGPTGTAAVVEGFNQARQNGLEDRPFAIDSPPIDARVKLFGILEISIDETGEDHASKKPHLKGEAGLVIESPTQIWEKPGSVCCNLLHPNRIESNIRESLDTLVQCGR